MKLVAHLLLTLASMLSVFPLLRMIGISLRTRDQIFSTDLSLIPQDASWRSYAIVFFETDLGTWLLNSLLITSITAVVGVSLAATAAYALSRYRFPGRRGMLWILLATQMMPAVMLLLPLYFLLQRANLMNTFAGVVIAYSVTALPFSIWLLKGYFDTVPRSIAEAAWVDGVTEMGSFWRVILPLSVPSLAIAFLFSMTQAWNEYIVARVILQDSALFTWPLGIFELQGDFDAKWGAFAAASVVVTIPVMTVFLISSRWLLSGLTLGGVKG